MAEKETDVKAVRVDYLCEACEVPMEHYGIVLACYPPLYPHACPSCGIKKNLPKAYPCITYREVVAPWLI